MWHYCSVLLWHFCTQRNMSGHDLPGHGFIPTGHFGSPSNGGTSSDHLQPFEKGPRMISSGHSTEHILFGIRQSCRVFYCAQIPVSPVKDNRANDRHFWRSPFPSPSLSYLGKLPRSWWLMVIGHGYPRINASYKINTYIVKEQLADQPGIRELFHSRSVLSSWLVHLPSHCIIL